MSLFSKFSLILCIAFSSASYGEVLHYKGKSTQPTKEGNSVCRVYVVKDTEGNLVKVSVDGYILKNYSPGITTRLMGDRAGTSQGWTFISMDTRDRKGQPIEASYCSAFSKNCLQSKLDENGLEMELRQAFPREDTYVKRSAHVKMAMTNGVPTEAEFSETENTKFMVFSETTNGHINCKDLKFVDAKAE